MKVWRVSHPSLDDHDGDVHFRTFAEARKLARDIKLHDMQRGVKASQRIPPEIAEISLPPYDKNLIVDILNGKNYIIAVRVVNAPRRHREPA